MRLFDAICLTAAGFMVAIVLVFATYNIACSNIADDCRAMQKFHTGGYTFTCTQEPRHDIQ